MNINLIVEKIPQIIASLYEDIYMMDKENQKFYQIKYDGKKITVTSRSEYSEFSKVFSNYQDDVVKKLESIEDAKIIFSTKDNLQKLISVKTLGTFKLIFINDITAYKEDSANKQTLLIADDSTIVTNFFKKTLENEFKILIAKNGEETIDLIEQHKEELKALFLDLNMPKKNGYEVLEYFKANNLFEKIPVSIISGEDSADGIEKVVSFEIVDILQKPFTADAVKTIVNKTIQSINRNQ